MRYILFAYSINQSYSLYMKTRYIKERLAELGKDESWLAIQCGVKAGTMKNSYLRGTKPSNAVLKLMAQSLQCSIADLVYESETEEAKVG